MSDALCLYFLLVSRIFDEPRARDHHIARFARLVRFSYQKSGRRYGPVKMNNEQLAEFWRCNVPAARACLADLKEFGWVDTRQVGQFEREILILAAWRNDGRDSAEDINAASTSASHLAAQATATPLPAPASDRSLEGATVVSTLTDDPNVVVVSSILNLNDDQQQQALSNNGVGLRAEGANQVRTLNEKQAANENSTLNRILGLLDRTPVAEPNRSRVAMLPHMCEGYLLPWVHYSQDNPDLGGGYFVKRFDAKELAPAAYRMRAADREEESIREADQRRRQREAYEAEIEEMRAEETDVESPSEPTPCPYRVDGTEKIWHAVLNALQTQTTKGVFDNWLRSTRALGWDGDQLVVGVHSKYAKEWIEFKLHSTIQRTMKYVLERAVEIRYEVQA